MIKAKSAQEFMDCFMRGDDATYKGLMMDLAPDPTIICEDYHVLILTNGTLCVHALNSERVAFSKAAKILHIPLQLTKTTLLNPWGIFKIPHNMSVFGRPVDVLVAYTGAE